MKQSLIGAVIALAAAAQAAQADQFITIGTGALTGVYYPAGGAICRQVNAGRKEHGVRCAVESTGGSITNIEALRSGDLTFGLVQSDIQFNALTGLSDFEGNGFPDLRAVFSVHSEPFTLVVRDDSGIESFEALKGRSVNLGNLGSGQRATMEVVMDAFGIGVADFASVAEYAAADMAAKICDGTVDALVYTVGHPAAAIKEAAITCGVHLVDVTGPAVDNLVAEHPYYAMTEIPAGLYPGTTEPTATFGVGATLVTTADTDEDIVYLVAKEVLAHLDDIRVLHPALAGLDAQAMVRDGLSAPLHPGAMRAFRELGLAE